MEEHLIYGNKNTTYHTFVVTDKEVSKGEYWRAGELLSSVSSPTPIPSSGFVEVWITTKGILISEAPINELDSDYIDRLAWRQDDGILHFIRMYTDTIREETP